MTRNLLITALIMATFAIHAFGQQKQKISGAIESNDYGIVKAINCMPDATYSQAPTNPYWATPSSDAFGSHVYHFVENYTPSIQTLRFFGIQAYMQNNEIVAQNFADDLNFVINLHSVENDSLGDLFYTDTLIISNNYTNVNYSYYYRIFYWDYIPEEEITDLPDQFWINIKNTDEFVWLYWLDQTGGDGHMLYTEAGDTTIYEIAQSLCLVSGEFCTASGGGTQYIDGVEMGEIENTSSGSNGYNDFTSLTTDIMQGERIPVTVTVPNFMADQDDLGVWIDFNDNNSFNDDGEQIYCLANQVQETNSFEILIPADAPLGSHTLRFRLKNAGDDCGVPCGDTEYGEVEDYTVNIIEATGINQSDNQIDFRVYPNPNNGIFTVSADGEYEIIITNTLGQVIYSNKILNLQQVDLSGYAKGMYIVTLKSTNEVSSLPIINN